VGNGFKRFIRFLYLSFRFKINVMSPLDTITYIQKHKCSVARFGDGELNMIMTDKSIGFQKYDQSLSHRLREVLLTNSQDVLICLPHTLDRFLGERQQARDFWSRFVIYNKAYIYHILKQSAMADYRFGDTQMTRPYMDYVKNKNAEKVYPELKKLWKDRDILIVEGSETRMGIGNDLFSGAASIKRVLCPAQNAFAYYDQILKVVQKLHRGELVLIALGPAATVLAADLSKTGIWAVDVGHLDIEYEWFRMGAKEKQTIQGKYVNEVSGGDDVEEIADETYLAQIVARVPYEGEK